MATITETITDSASTSSSRSGNLLKKYGFGADQVPTDSPRPYKDTIQRIASSDGADKIVSALKQDGGVIVENFLSAELAQRLNEDLDPQLDDMYVGCMDPATMAIDSVKEFHGLNTKRFTNLVTRSKVWREEVIETDLAYDILDKVYREESGSFWQSTAQVIELGPKSAAQVLHHDGANLVPFWLLGPDGPEFHINMLIAMSDTTEENGATRVIPGSHKWNLFDLGDSSMTVPATMKKGDALVFDCRLVHGGGENKSDKNRRMIAWTFCPGYITPEEAAPLVVPREVAKGLSYRAQKILGFRSQYVKGAAGLWMTDMNEVGNCIGMDK